MRSNSFLILIIIGLVIYLTVFYVQQGNHSQNSRDIAFAIADTGKVDKIELIRRVRGEVDNTLVLSRLEHNQWTVNNDKPAFQARIDMLLTTLQSLQVREVLVDKGLEAGKLLLEEQHTEVNVFQHGRKLKSIWIGREGKNAQGSLMMIKGRNKPYVVEVPGFRGYLNSRFTLDTAYWYEHPYITIDQSLFQKIKLRYPFYVEGNPSFRSLTFVRKDEQEAFSWIIDKEPEAIEKKDIDSLAIKNYLSSFKGKMYALREIDFDEENITLERNPYAVFHMVRNDGYPLNYWVFEAQSNRDYYYVLDDAKRWLLFQRFVLDPFLWRK